VAQPPGAIDAEAINRILDAIGREHVPQTLDRAALGSELTQCATWYAVASDVTDLAQAKRDFKDLKDINKTTRRLDYLLRKNDLTRHDIAAELPGGMATLEATVRGVIATTDALGSLVPYSADREAEIEKHLVAAIDDKQGTPQVSTTPLTLAEVRSWKGSALEWLAGKRLPEVFERHFGAKARLTRAAAGEVGGPYIRFAARTMVELGLPCKPETIAKAVTAARTGRARSR
jgi:hypothetical protein